MEASKISVFSTCPESRTVRAGEYASHVARVAEWSEAAGLDGILVYAENGLVDPWLVAQLIVQATERLNPLVAVQPAYMHPYAVAKMVATLAHLYGRRTHLNLVAGGFRNDLIALGDATTHSERYERLVEYARIIQRLAAGGPPVSEEGRFYRTHELRLTPSVAADLQPGFMVSGSSEAGLAAARAIGATAVKYPRPTGEEPGAIEPELRCGIRIGLIAREDSEEAWRVAYERFPENRAGQITHQLAMGVSDSQWHRQLSELASEAAERNTPYWLGPFQNYLTFCPYLVGDVQTVAHELASYLKLGIDTFILDIPPSREELDRSVAVLKTAASHAE